jgi:iron complex transport system substrate-binding protein
MPPSPRIVSLIASTTEMVCALGLEECLVGRSHECDYPTSVQRLPVCTRPKFEPDGTSYEIDQRVKAILQEGLSVYRVDAELLRSLQPTVILTQSQCEVCAVSEKDVEAAVCTWLEAKPRIVSLKPDNLADVWRDIRIVGEALGVPERAARLVASLEQRVLAVRGRVCQIKASPGVACIEWLDPLMAAGNWMPELVEAAGGRNLFGEAGKHSPFLDWATVRAADPDILLLLPCGFDIPRIRQELPAMTRRDGWDTLRAVRARDVYLLDGNAYFNRPGPRLAESLEILAEILHPGQFHYGHEGHGWQRM